MRVVSVNDRGHAIGQDHWRAKFSDADVDLMVALKAEGLSYHDVAVKFECSKSTVRDYCKGRRRGHLVIGQKVLAPTPARRRYRPARADEFDLIV